VCREEDRRHATLQSVVNGVAYNCGKQFGARSLGPRTHTAQRQRHQKRRNAARDSPVVGTALRTYGGAKRPRPQHVKNQEGSGCVLGACLTASIDGVWQHDVKYMCKYSTTSFIDHFNKIEYALSHCGSCQRMAKLLEEEHTNIFYTGQDVSNEF
jgi:bacterioferritin-associated ferredoxin